LLCSLRMFSPSRPTDRSSGSQVCARCRRSKRAEARGAERTSGSCWASAAGRARAEAGSACAASAARRGGACAERTMWAAPRRASARWPSSPARPRHARNPTSAPARSMLRAHAAALPLAELAAARRKAGHQAANAAAGAAAAVRRPAVPAVRAFSPQPSTLSSWVPHCISTCNGRCRLCCTPLGKAAHVVQVSMNPPRRAASSGHLQRSAHPSPPAASIFDPMLPIVPVAAHATCQRRG